MRLGPGTADRIATALRKRVDIEIFGDRQGRRALALPLYQFPGLTLHRNGTRHSLASAFGGACLQPLRLPPGKDFLGNPVTGEGRCLAAGLGW